MSVASGDGKPVAIKANQFVAKDKKIGSWDPNSVYWEEMEVSFVGQLWGLKAQIEVVEGSNPRRVRMLYPLNVTEVTYQSEANMLGIEVRDVITAVRPDTIPGADFIKVTSVTDIDNKRQYVTEEVKNILMKGGACTLKLKRERYYTKCSNCSSEAPLLEDMGDLVCSACGVINRTGIMSMQSEWRSFADDDGKDDPNRAGGPEDHRFNGDGMGTQIAGGASRMVNGRPRPGDEKIGSAASLSRSQYKSGGHSIDAALQKGYSEITSMCNKLDLNKSVVSKACEIFKKVEEEKVANKKLKRNPECVIAACVYVACLIKDVPRTFKEFGRGVTSEQVTKSEMGKAVKHIKAIVNVQMGETIGVGKAKDILQRICTRIKASNEVLNAAVHIVEEAEKIAGVCDGRQAASVAGAGAYMARILWEVKTGGGTSSSTICSNVSTASGAAEATIRDVFRSMLSHRHKLVPAGFATPEQIQICGSY